MKKLISLFALSVFCLVLSAPVWAAETCTQPTDRTAKVLTGGPSEGGPAAPHTPVRPLDPPSSTKKGTVA